MSKSPDQALYDACWVIAESSGLSVYAYTPPLDTPYPFIRFAGTQLVPRGNKTGINAAVAFSFDVWDDGDHRGRCTEIANRLARNMSAIKNLNTGQGTGLSAVLHDDRTSVEVTIDQSTNNDLWRARVSLEWLIY